MVVALVLAGHTGRFPRLCMVLLLRAEKRDRMGRRVFVGKASGCAVRKAHAPVLHGQVVCSLSNHETYRMGR